MESTELMQRMILLETDFRQVLDQERRPVRTNGHQGKDRGRSGLSWPAGGLDQGFYSCERTIRRRRGPLPDPPAGDKGLQESGKRTEEVAVTYPRFAAFTQ